MRIRNLAAALGALALFLVIGCILDGRQAGRGSEVENELGIYGILVDASGKPVQGARVKALPAAAAADTDSVVTDGKGRYAFDSLPSGAYNLLGDFGSGSLVVLIPDVKVRDSAQDLGIDTLRTPGSIRGRFLAGSMGKAGILAVVAGISRLELSDDSGRFQINGVPQGRYTLRYNGPGYIIPEDTGVVVKAERTTVLPDKHLEYDPALSPPEPIGLKARYDTLSERVLLSWEVVPVSDLDGFLIYRDDPAFMDPQVVPGGFTKGTTFIDSTFSKASMAQGWTLTYRVRSRDLKANKSINFSDPVEVRVAPKELVTTTAAITIEGLKAGAASPRDSLSLILAYSNPTRRIREVAWFTGKQAEPVRVIPGSVGHPDTLRWLTGGPGAESFTARLEDEAGTLWSASASYQVLLDPPRVNAGGDREASPSDSIRLQGSGTDAYGRVERWKWSIGGSPFVDAPGGSIAFRTPTATGLIPCVLEGIDDDDISAYDTVFISVVTDPPSARAGADTAVSIGDKVRLHGKDADGLGRVVDVEWDIGGGGEFRRAPAETIVTAPLTPRAAYLCILRVTDDDGNTALDTAAISVAADPPILAAGSDTVVSIGDTLRLRGSGQDKYGDIVEWKWSCGGEAPIAGDPATTRIAPSAPVAAYPCVLIGTDDDGQSAADSLFVKVVQDEPTAILASDAPSEAFSGDTVALSGAGSRDGFGKIVKYEWDFGAKGTFIASAKPETAWALPNVPGSRVKVTMRVTDDDGNIASDSLIFGVHATGGAEWLTAVDPAPFPARYGSKTVAFAGKLWVIAGYEDRTGGGYLSDIWSSPDGAHWTRVTDHAPFGPRYDHAVAVFNNRIWVIGGSYSGPKLKDIWSSADGITWRQETASAPFPGRASPGVAVFGGKLWIMGGLTYQNGDKLLNDVWSTPDGVNWTQETANAAFPARARAGCAVFASKLWLVGGWMEGAVAGGAWSSTNGKDWVLASSDPVLDRQYPALLPFGGALWMLGGFPGAVSQDVYRSADGMAWSKVLQTGPFPSRYNFGAEVFRGKMWLLSGGIAIPGSAALPDNTDVIYSE
jgi:hypothetical protein